MVGLNRDQIRELHLVIENYHLLQINSFVGFDYLYSDEQAIVQDILGSSLGLDAMIPHIEKYYKLGIIRAQNPDSLIDSIDWREMDRFLSNESRVIDLNTKEKDILSNLKSDYENAKEKFKTSKNNKVNANGTENIKNKDKIYLIIFQKKN